MAYPGYPPAGGYQQGGYPPPGGYPPQGGYPQGGYPPPGGYPGGGYPGADQGGYYGGGVRQYFFIKSKLNGLVLDIDGVSRNPGAKIHMWNKKDTNNDNQLWYDDPSTGTIRSKLHDFCLDVEGGLLVVKPFQPGDPNQQWMRADNVIRNRINQNQVLDIARGDRNTGATLCAWNHHGGPNQTFEYEFFGSGGQAPTGSYYPGAPTGSYPPAGGYTHRAEFHIASEMNGKVMDISGGSANAGAKVIMYHKKSPPGKNQLWYIDQQGVIRSALNDFSLHGSGKGDDVQMQPFHGGSDQQWRFQDKRIVNPNGECLDIKGGGHHDGAEVIVYHYKGSNNQHWRAEYV